MRIPSAEDDSLEGFSNIQVCIIHKFVEQGCAKLQRFFSVQPPPPPHHLFFENFCFYENFETKRLRTKLETLTFIFILSMTV